MAMLQKLEATREDNITFNIKLSSIEQSIGMVSRPNELNLLMVNHRLRSNSEIHYIKFFWTK